MRKIVIISVLCFTTMLKAQNVKFGPVVNFQFNCPSGLDSKTGFNAGLRGELYFNKEKRGMFVDAALLYDKRNFSSSGYYYNDYQTGADYEYSTYGISIPVNFGYKFSVAKHCDLFAAIGPYINIGMGGKTKYIYTPKSQNDTRATDNAFEHLKDQKHEAEKSVETMISNNVYSDKLLNRMEWGFDIRIGAEIYRHYQLNASYGLGMSNIFKENFNYKHRTFSIGVAYMF